MSKISITNNKTNVLQSISNVILALQHLIAMFGATVLVPILTGLDTNVALVSAGVGTLIFHFVTKRKVPVFLGSSFAFIAGIVTVGKSFGDLRYAQGGMVIAGVLYIIISVFLKYISIDTIRKFLPNHVVGPMIIIIGLSLLPVAIDMSTNNLAFTNTHLILAISTLLVTLSIIFFAKGFLKQLAILIGVSFGYILALFISKDLVALSEITHSAIFSIPNFTLPRFSLGAAAIIAPIVLAVFMEHIGDITTNSEVCGKNFIDDPGLNRTLLGDGLATVFAAFIGGPANTTYGENTGVLAITKNYNPFILRITAVFAIILGFVGKVGGVLKSIPIPVMGGISIILFSMIAIIGVRMLFNGKVEFNTKNLLVIIAMLIIGLGTKYSEHYLGTSFGIPIAGVNISGLSLAAIIGVLLNLMLSINSKEYKTELSSKA